MKKIFFLILTVVLCSGCEQPSVKDIAQKKSDKIVLYDYDHPEDPRKNTVIGTITEKSDIRKVEAAIREDFTEEYSEMFLMHQMKFYRWPMVTSVDFHYDPVTGVVDFRDGYSKKLFDVLVELGILERLDSYLMEGEIFEMPPSHRCQQRSAGRCVRRL